ncbi:MAG: class I SAM-dependent methyltransferase [Flavobacteriales bacterium]|nr:class I SAM-dependent methyltransferase [Flavobacteriales bacterium]
MERKEHWENIYTTKSPQEVSWTQAIPQVSLDFIRSFGQDTSASIIDIGGGDSHLVDFLLDAGYTDITVLDISSKALERAQERLGDRAQNVKWIVSDIVNFHPSTSYDIWHDRAVFHFLTEAAEIERYVQLVNESVNHNMVIGTFSENGPLKCSGLEITQYSKSVLSDRFNTGFETINCIQIDHTTPFETTQNFTFCSFAKEQ